MDVWEIEGEAGRMDLFDDGGGGVGLELLGEVLEVTVDDLTGE